MSAFETSFLRSETDDLKLSIRLALPDDGAPKGVILLVHDMADHKERYAGMMEYLRKAGYAALVSDLRGHGLSMLRDSDLGYFYDAGAEGLLSDQKKITETLRKHFPGVPLYLYGHGMGALIAAVLLHRHGDLYAGAFLSGMPPKSRSVSSGKLLCRTAALFGGWHSVSQQVINLTTGPYAARFEKERSRWAWIAADPAVVAAYEADPLCGFPLTVNGYYAYFNLMEATWLPKTQPVAPDVPIALTAGADDPAIGSLTRFREMKESLLRMGYTNVDSRLYPLLRHEIHNDRDREEVWNDIPAYIEAWAKGEKPE